jgi:hypothetical protein
MRRYMTFSLRDVLTALTGAVPSLVSIAHPATSISVPSAGGNVSAYDFHSLRNLLTSSPSNGMELPLRIAYPRNTTPG